MLPMVHELSHGIKVTLRYINVSTCMGVLVTASNTHTQRRGESLDFLNSLSDAMNYCKEHLHYDFSFWEDHGRLP